MTNILNMAKTMKTNGRDHGNYEEFRNSVNKKNLAMVKTMKNRDSKGV